MTTNVVNTVKKACIFLLFLVFSISCENEIQSIETDFISNKHFSTNEVLFDVNTSTRAVDRVESTGLGQFLLGVYNHEDFGTLQASLISQLNLPTNVFKYSDSLYTDSTYTSTVNQVYLYIPYQFTATQSQDDGSISVELDSVFGIHNEVDDAPDTYGTFQLQVHELDTYLNPLDPTNPAKTNTFYTDKTYLTTANGNLTSVVNITPSANDTVTYVSRTLNGEVDVDTIRIGSGLPRLAIPLDASFFQTKILDNLPVKGETPLQEFSSNDDFYKYFNGLYLKTISTAPASMVSLNFDDAFVEMYYTNSKKSKADNGTVDEKQNMSFALGGIQRNQYVHDHNRKNETDKLYVQGAGGYEVDFEVVNVEDAGANSILNGIDFDALKTNANDADGKLEWLINEASIKVYVDEDFVAQNENIHQVLFLYKKGADNGFQITDYYSSRFSQGVLTKDEELSTETKNVYYYKFLLTDYITQLLNGSLSEDLSILSLKVAMANFDLPENAADNVVETDSWIPKGVVLYDGSEVAKKIQLLINYSFKEKD